MAQTSGQKLIKTRKEKLEAIKSSGINPYPPTSDRSQTIAQAKDMMDKKVTVAGRIMAIRGHGKLNFIDLVDESGQIQLFVSEKIIGEKEFELIKLLDSGDFLEASGKVIKTVAGEVSVETEKTKILSKSLRPLPNTWFGFKDVEERFRKRYLDLILNEKVKKTLDARWKIEQAIRTFLWGEGYKEVETPVLQPLYGGTNASPFTTHLNALDIDL